MNARRVLRWASLPAITVGLLASRAPGAAPPDAKYAGAKLCAACHQGMHPKVVTAWTGSGHARALWKVGDADATHKVVADLAKAPFPKDQVAFVLGAGLRRQAFLGKDLQVLPAEWVVKGKAWRPRPAADAKVDCLGCHTTGYDPQAGAWAAEGVGCEMCHGPGSAHTGAADKKGTVTRPQDLDPARQAMICGRCHAQGKSLDDKYTFPTECPPGADLDQHFSLAGQVAPGSSNSQYNDMRLGGGKHLAAGVVCTTCHLAHGSAGQPASLRAPVNELCLGCHQGKLTGPQHQPAALQAVTCATCHMPGGSHRFVPPGKS